VIDPEEIWDARQDALEQIGFIKADIADCADLDDRVDDYEWVDSKRRGLARMLARQESLLRDTEALLTSYGYPLERPLQEARP
jgi:hypothetical protein